VQLPQQCSVEGNLVRLLGDADTEGLGEPGGRGGAFGTELVGEFGGLKEGVLAKGKVSVDLHDTWHMIRVGEEGIGIGRWEE
jgi:hypothetical protein